MTGSIFSWMRVSKMSCIRMPCLLSRSEVSEDIAPVHKLLVLVHKGIHTRLGQRSWNEDYNWAFERALLVPPEFLHDGAWSCGWIERGKALQHDDQFPASWFARLLSDSLNYSRDPQVSQFRFWIRPWHRIVHRAHD